MTPFVRKVTQANFNDLARLMEARGGPDFCWCMAWRDKPREDMTQPTAARKAARKAQLQARVARGAQIGLLAYDGAEPVGWCSVGPLSGFRRLGGPVPDDPDTVWAISCFFIPRPWRGQGVMRTLVLAAIDAARAAGARSLQATPVQADSPSYRFMGFVPLFQKLGFDPIAAAGHRRQVMRRAL